MNCTTCEELMPEIFPNLIKVANLKIIYKSSVNPGQDKSAHRCTLMHAPLILSSQTTKYQRQRNL